MEFIQTFSAGSARRLISTVTSAVLTLVDETRGKPEMFWNDRLWELMPKEPCCLLLFCSKICLIVALLPKYKITLVIKKQHQQKPPPPNPNLVLEQAR